MRKKGKLKSGRVRSGLPVIRDQDWPHESINTILAGRKFESNTLTENAFIAGILNSVITSDDFKKLKRKFPSEVTQKLIVLNELVHTLIRSRNFEQVKEFYYASLEDIETATASWKDSAYWEAKLSFF